MCSGNILAPKGGRRCGNQGPRAAIKHQKGENTSQTLQSSTNVKKPMREPSSEATSKHQKDRVRHTKRRGTISGTNAQRQQSGPRREMMFQPEKTTLGSITNKHMFLLSSEAVNHLKVLVSVFLCSLTLKLKITLK